VSKKAQRALSMVAMRHMVSTLLIIITLVVILTKGVHFPLSHSAHLLPLHLHPGSRNKRVVIHVRQHTSPYIDKHDTGAGGYRTCVQYVTLKEQGLSTARTMRDRASTPHSDLIEKQTLPVSKKPSLSCKRPHVSTRSENVCFDCTLCVRSQSNSENDDDEKKRREQARERPIISAVVDDHNRARGHRSVDLPASVSQDGSGNIHQ